MQGGHWAAPSVTKAAVGAGQTGALPRVWGPGSVAAHSRMELPCWPVPACTCLPRHVWAPVHASRAQSCTAWVACVALGTGGTLGSVLAGRRQQPERRRSHLGRVGATVAQLGLKPSFENDPCSFLRGGFR